MMMSPSYLHLYKTGELARRVEIAREMLAACTLCPHRCGVNRLQDERGLCRTGARAVVNDTMPHFGEENPLVGTGGSGAIFFSHCTLGCVFCQTWEISHKGEGEEIDNHRLAELMFMLQEDGCHNINLVTPSHVIPQILDAVRLAAAAGLNLPLVYNSSGYDSPSGLRLLEDVVDIYLPDFKFWKSDTASQLAGAADYPEAARTALKEMYRQVGDLRIDAAGLAMRGLLVRHLILPGHLDETREIISFMAQEISPGTYLNLMGHYRPCGEAAAHPPLHRSLSATEYETARGWAQESGISRLDETHTHLLRHMLSSAE